MDKGKRLHRVNIFCHNFDYTSNSGPNKFTRQLFLQIQKNKKINITSQEEADVEFCLIQMIKPKIKKAVLRLDGIYFNSDQDFDQQNTPIKYSYENADAVVFQSEFNKLLTEAWFGSHDNYHVIHNGADLELIKKIPSTILDNTLSENISVWSCASSWRPHKRLEENIRYFLEHADKKTVFAIAGKNPDFEVISKYQKISNNRILYLGELDYASLISLYKRSEKFIHLAYLDHCPNVVVDAQASGCDVVCSNSGGTKEIVYRGKVIMEDEWDFSPIQLYKPPAMNFERYQIISRDKCDSIKESAEKYLKVLESQID